jgi:hypothetical protein
MKMTMFSKEDVNRGSLESFITASIAEVVGPAYWKLIKVISVQTKSSCCTKTPGFLRFVHVFSCFSRGQSTATRDSYRAIA